MQTATAMNVDIKALLTLLLLKTGTSSREIQTILMVAATSRVIVAEETVVPERASDEATSNVASFRPRPDTAGDAAEHELTAFAMNSDIKALLTLVLLQNGVSSSEIQTTLRMAAASRLSILESQREAFVQRAAGIPADVRPMTARQALRADHLAPISMKEFAAA